jgi:hypothetical protein
MASIAEAIICEMSKDLPEADLLRSLRTNIEPYIYNHLSQRYYAKLQAHWDSYMPPLHSKYAYVIVERRCHPNFDFVLKNMAWANPNMAIYIFCSDYNEKFIYSLLGDKVKNVNIVQAFTGEGGKEGIPEFSKLLCSKEMYEVFHPDTEYILTIQMDVFIRRKITEELFVGDFWGAPWAWNEEAPGGGGATVRKVASMLDICRKHQYHGDTGKEAEDTWFSNRVAEGGYKILDLEFRATHIMESLSVDDPVLVHQFWTFLSTQGSFDEIVAYIEQILTLDM